MAKTNIGLVEYAIAQLGKPYWWGTYGKGASRSYYEAKKAQYPTQYKWAYDSALEGVKVHDCVGLIKGYLWCDDVNDTSPSYKKDQDRSANGLRRACKVTGNINTMPEVLGLLVFFDGHVGVYVGGGYVVEAKGHSTGVIKTKLSERPWKTWGYCPFVDYDNITAQKQNNNNVVETNKKEQVNNTGGDTVSITLSVLRKYAEGEQVKTLQRLLMAHGYSLPKFKDDGDFGAETLAAVKAFQKDKGLDNDGVVGKKTWSALLGVS